MGQLEEPETPLRRVAAKKKKKKIKVERERTMSGGEGVKSANFSLARAPVNLEWTLASEREKDGREARRRTERSRAPESVLAF